MLDLFLKWPLRVAVLGAVASAAAAGKCGSRPTYMGAGGAGVGTTPTVVVPAYQNHDTTATSVLAEHGPGYAFNPGNRNQLGTVALDRTWVRERSTMGVGAGGYQGTYHFDPFEPGRSFRYAGVAAQGLVMLHFRVGQLEFRPLAIQLALAREWGAWAELRATAPRNFELPSPYPNGYPRLSTPVEQTGGVYWHGQGRFTSGFVTVPRGRWRPVFGLSGGVLATQGHAGLHAQLMLGAGPFKLYGNHTTLGGEISDQVTRFGLAVDVPVWRR